MNRYSNYTPSAYSPMTMQEIMLVPLAMREQHNKAQQQISAEEAELAKINALPVHTDEAKQRKEYLQSRIQALSSDLANQGFNNVTTGNILKLNREVTDEFSPQGRLGKINNAYSTYMKNLEEFKKSVADKKWSQDEFNLNWNKHINQYQGYDEKGDITNIDSLMAPEKVTIENKWKELSAIMGDSKMASDILTGGATITQGPNGSALITTTKTGQKIAYNNPQVVAALRQIQGELNDPTSDLSKSRIFAGQSVEKALQEAENLGISKLNIEQGITNTTDLNLEGYKNSADLAAQQGSVTTVDTEEVPLHNQDSYGQSKITINNIENKIKNNQHLTDDDKEKYAVAKGMMFNYEQSVKDGQIGDKLTTSEGKKLSSHFAQQLGLPVNTKATFKYVADTYRKAKETFLNKFKPGTKEYTLAKAKIENNMPILTAEIASSHGATSKSKELTTVDNIFDKVVGKYQRVYHDYKNAIFTKSNTYSNFYDVVTSDSQSETGKRFSILSDKIINSIKSPSAENSIGNISAITDTDGNLVRLTGKENIAETRRNIINVMRESKDVKIVGYSDNDGGFPSIKFRVTPDKDNDISETIYGSSDWNDGKIGNKKVGGKKEFDVILRLGDFSNIKNSKNKYSTNSATTEILTTMYQTGDTKTKEFAKKALERIQVMSKI